MWVPFAWTARCLHGLCPSCRGLGRSSVPRPSGVAFCDNNHTSSPRDILVDSGKGLLLARREWVSAVVAALTSPLLTPSLLQAYRRAPCGGVAHGTTVSLLDGAAKQASAIPRCNGAAPATAGLSPAWDGCDGGLSEAPCDGVEHKAAVHLHGGGVDVLAVPLSISWTRRCPSTGPASSG